jgi:hypothetical protein
VLDVRVLDRDSGGVVTLEVAGAPDAGLAPVLAKAVAFRGWTLHELSPKQISLEDLFVEILERAEHERAGGSSQPAATKERS